MFLTVSNRLQKSTTQHLTSSWNSKYTATLLANPNLTIKRSPPINPATIVLVGSDENILAVTAPRPDLEQTPIPNTDCNFYIDGSSSRHSNGRDLNAGYAVVTDHDVVECDKLPNDCSAQKAELFALTHACILSKGKTATIYTDSKYAFYVVHGFGTLWRQRGLLQAREQT